MRQASAVASRPVGRGILAALGLVASVCTVSVGLVAPLTSTPTAEATGTFAVAVTHDVALDGTALKAGDTVSFTVTVSNSTGADATNVAITDDSDTSTWGTCSEGAPYTIADNASKVCTVTDTVTQADVDDESFDINVNATATPSLSASGADSIAILQVPKVALAVTSSLADSNLSTRNDAGDTVTYTFTATNTGNLVLTTVAISDVLSSGTFVGGSCSNVAPGSTCVATRTVVLTQAHIDAGSISDEGSVAATSSTTNPSASTTAKVVSFTRVSSATITKSAGSVTDTNDSHMVDAGDTARFSIVVTNTGTTTLDPIDISDPAASASKNCAPLAPAATCTLVVDYVLLQADVDAGSFENTASYTATGHAGSITGSATRAVTITPQRSLTIITAALSFTDTNGDLRPNVGEVVPFTVAVSNDGNVTLTSVEVTSTHTATTKSCATLAPLATCTLSASYTLTQADIDSGSIVIDGSVTETSLSGSDDAPSLTLARAAIVSVNTATDAPTDGDIAVGDTFTFTVTVSNTGNTTITGVTVADSLAGGGEGGTTPCATLLPGASCTLTQPHTVTQTDVDAGEVADIGSVTATVLSGLTLSETGTPSYTVSIDRTATVSASAASSFNDANSNGRGDAGEVITFTVTGTNTGNTTLTAMTVGDSLTGGTTGGTTPCATVAPSGTCTFSRTHALTQSDIDSGSVDDTGSVSATAASGLTDPTASDLETYTIARAATLGIVTTHAAYVDANSNSRPDAGETITFTVTATNSANTTLTTVTVSDSLTGGTTGGTSPCASVAPGGTCTFTRAHPLTQAEINAGSVTDTGSATATPPTGVTLTATPNADTVTVARSSDMSITKSTTGIVITDGSGYPVAGDTVPYTVTATNTGNTTVTAVTVADELTAASTTCASVAPGATCVLNTDYHLTQSDINAGTRSNKGTVIATAPDTSIAKNVTISTSITQHHHLSLTNVAGSIVDVNNNGKQDKNDTVTFTLTATNSGNTTLSSVSITSPLTSATHSCGTMVPGATCSFTSTYTLTQADVNTGSITNAATAAGTAPSGVAGAITASASTTVTIAASFSFSLTKTTPGYVDANSNSRADAGEVITYTVTATNNGTTKFTSATISDTQTVATHSCGAMDPAETCTWTFDHTLTQSDIDSGSVSGTATVTGSGRGGGSATATAINTVTITRSATASLVTTSGGVTEVVGAGHHDAGDRVTFTVTVTNTGNTTLTAMTVTDSIGSGSTVCASVAPGGTCVLTTTHTLTQSDVDAGSVSDTGSLVATAQSGLTLSTTGTATATQTITRTALASVVTTAATFVDTDGDTYADAGETIAFTVTVTNSGNTTLTSMTVSDTLTDGTPGGSSPCATVAPGATCTRTRTHTLTQAEVDAGSVTNTGSVTATVQSGLTLSTDGTPAKTVTIVRSSTVTLANTAGSLVDASLPAGASPGDTIAYTIVATNTGTTTLTGVSLTDGVTVGTNTCATVAPAATCSLSTIYTLVQSDIDAGKVDNTASLGYTGHAGAGSATKKATTTITQTNTMTFSNVAGSVTEENASGRTDVGDSVTYTLTMHNTGNTTLTSVSMYSPKNTYTKSCGTVAPGSSCSATTKYLLVQADINAGSVSNAATASATSPGGALSGSDTATTTLPQTSSISLAMTAGSLVDANSDLQDDAGDTITYTVTATNTGTTTLTSVAVTDALTAGSQSCASVAPSATCVLTATYTLLQAELDLGQVDNNGTVTGTGHQGQVSAAATRSVSITRVGSVSLAVTAGAITDTNSTPAADAGDTVTFTVTARNTGNTTLRSVVVTDSLTSGTKRCSTLAPSATCVLTATHTLEVADIDAGSVSNSAAVAASAFDGARSASASASATMPQASSISLATSAATPSDDNRSGRVDAGDTIVHTLTATNDGNSTLTSITVQSDLTAASTSCSRLAPGEDCTLTTSHTLTQSELDAGTITHAGRSSATAPDGAVSDTDSIATSITRVSTVGVSTTASAISDYNSSGRHDAGDRVTFTVTATNTGTVTLTSMTVGDSLADGTVGGSTPCSSIAPGATCTRTRVHTLTQTEVDAGSATDTGSATATGHSGAVSGSGARAVSITRTNTLSVVTSASAITDNDANGDDAGDTLTFTVTVTNTGNTTLLSMTVSDTLSGGTTGGTAPCATVAPAATCTLTRTHTLTQTEMNAGAVTDTGSASATRTSSGTVTGSNARTVSLGRTNRIAVITSAGALTDANSSGRDDAGDTIAYTVTATNTGTTTLTAVTVSLPLTGGTATCATLAPGSDCVLHSTRAVVQAEMDVGRSVGAGSAIATAPTGAAGSITGTGSTTVSLTRASSVSIVDSAGSITDQNSSGRDDAGDTIMFTVTATNTGSTTLTGVVVSDDLTEATETCPSVAPGATCVLLTGHTLTLTDLDHGYVRNSTSVVGTGHAGSVSATDTEDITVHQSSTVSITNHAGGVVDANGSLRVDADDTVAFGILVVNTGTTILRGVHISDPLTGGAKDCPDLLPGVKCTFITRYVLQLADVNDGKFTNTATVTATGHAGSVSASHPVVVELVQTAQVNASSTYVDLVDTDLDGHADAGEFALFALRATNTGNTTLNRVQVTDPDHGATATCLGVAPGDYCEVISNVPISQYDIDTNQIGSSAVVTAKPPNGADVGDEVSTITDLSTSELVGVAISETGRTDADSDGVLELGDTFTVTIVATNTGSRTLHDVVVADGHVPHTTPCSSLAPSATCTLVVTHSITSDDITLGYIETPGAVTALAPDLDEVNDDTSLITLLDPSGPTLHVSVAVTRHTDSDSSGTITTGDVLRYTVSARNLATTTAHAVALLSRLTLEQHTCETVPGYGTCSFTTDHTVTRAEAGVGSLISIATAVSTEVKVAQTGSVTTTLVGGEQLTIVATLDQIDTTVIAPNDRVDAGDAGSWTYTITNTGDTALTGLELTGLVADDVVCPAGALASIAVDAVVVCTLDLTITQPLIDAEEVDVSLTVTSASSTADSDTLVTPLAVTTGIALVKTVRGRGAACDDTSALPAIGIGGTARWCFAITNTGNRTLESLLISDAALAITDLASQPDGITPTLAPGATLVVSFTSTHDTSLTNTATVSATVVGTIGAGGTLVTSDESTATLTVSPIQPVTGEVWFDLDLDGARDDGEPLLPDVPVTLSTSAEPDIPIASAVTDSDGAYSFDEVMRGTYVVEAETGVRGIAALSDGDGGTDWTTAIEVIDAPIVANFGGTGMASMSGRIIDATLDRPIRGASVTCSWIAFDGVFGSPDDVAFTATTNGDGRYTLARLPYGDMRCRFSAPGFADPEEIIVPIDAPTTPFGDMFFGRQTPLVGDDPRPLLALASLLGTLGCLLVVTARRRPWGARRAAT